MLKCLKSRNNIKTSFGQRSADWSVGASQFCKSNSNLVVSESKSRRGLSLNGKELNKVVPELIFKTLTWLPADCAAIVCAAYKREREKAAKVWPVFPWTTAIFRAQGWPVLGSLFGSILSSGSKLGDISSQLADYSTSTHPPLCFSRRAVFEAKSFQRSSFISKLDLE